MRFVIITIISLLATCSMSAATQAIEVSLDKKVIYADSLNLAPNTDVATMLSLLPELLERPGWSAITHYDIKIQGISVGNASDVTLYQLRLNDIEKIEISDSPVSSYLNNGQGGSIDITLREPLSRERKTWGSAAVSATYPTDVMGQVNVAVRSKKVLVRGLAMADYYYGTERATSQSYVGGAPAGSAQTTETTTKFWSQMARVYCTYMPTMRDLIKINVSEHRSGRRDMLGSGDASDRPAKQYAGNTSLQSYLKYEHAIRKRSNLTVEAQYVYSPQDNSYNDYAVRAYDNHKRSHNLAGKVELKVSVLRGTTDKHYLDLTAGVNGSKTWVSQQMSNIDNSFKDASVARSDVSGDASYLMPYISAESTLGNISFKAAAQYHLYRQNIDAKKDFKQRRNDFTFNVMGEWHITPAHTVRLTLDRALQRPTAEQCYPYLIYHPLDMVYTKGNVELTTMLLHQVGAEYIALLHSGHHSLQVNVGGRYNHVSDIVCPYFDMVTPPPGAMGLSLRYRTYVNDGTNDIFSGNLMAIYSYRRFTLSLAANVYHNTQRVFEEKDHYDYFNISVLPAWQLPRGWNTSLGIIYYSKVSRLASTLGSSAHANINVSKSWGPVNVSVYGTIGLDGMAKDEDISSENTSVIKEYRPVSNSIGMAINYLF